MDEMTRHWMDTNGFIPTPEGRSFLLDTNVLLHDADSLSAFEEHNLVLDTDKVAGFRVDRAPAIAVMGKTDLGIRYYGVPAGYELASLVDAVLLAGNGAPALTTESLAQLETLDHPVDIKVFVTPT